MLALTSLHTLRAVSRPSQFKSKPTEPPSLAAAKASLLSIGGQTTSPKQKYSHSSIYSRFGFGSCSPLNSLLSHSSIQPVVFTFSWQSIRPQIPAETARNITTTNLLDTYSRTVLPRSLENQRMSPNQSMKPTAPFQYKFSVFA